MCVNLIERLTAENYLLEKHLEHFVGDRLADVAGRPLEYPGYGSLVERLERCVRALTARAEALHRDGRTAPNLDELYAQLVSGIR
ncbi:MAG: hypothetical protein ACLPYS_15060 [Vulcanimicrobiaceae bacterium]